MTDKNDNISDMLNKMMAVSTLHMIEMGLRITQSRILDKGLARSYMDKLIALNDKLELDTDPVTIKQIADQTKVIVEEVMHLPLTQARDWGAIITATLPNFSHILKGGDDGFDRDQFRMIVDCVRDILRDMTPISLDTDDDKSVIEAIEGWDKGSAVKQVLHQLDVSVTQVVLGVVTADQAVSAAHAAKDKALAAMQTIAL